ncbi:MG2 domain-containing protein [Roseiconus lacunae]|uniref:MG2 domain-containing protein n=1 Tax=Roseiconus lacunae TaxID=2605694 RepID=A0ABT7PC42_9BACT|nr:MG2 domain-containing protein [Roseiconus lacunae]MDM4013831.1 MG2 domain-containing protein [Roseiconus lacunae]
MNFNQHPEHPPHDDDQLRQQLLELHYELLDDDEVESLRSRINRDPHVATLWAQTLRMAGKFAEAAKLDASAGPPFDLSTVVAESQHQTTGSEACEHVAMSKASADGAFGSAIPTSQPGSSSDNPIEVAGDTKKTSSRFIKLWWVSLVTAASLLIAITGFRHWNRLPPLPVAPLHVAIEPIAGPEATSQNEFWVVVNSKGIATETSGGQPGLGFGSALPIVPANISFQVLSKGSVLYRGQTETTADHPARIQIPNEIVIPVDAELQIDAWADPEGKKRVRLTTPLEPTRCLTFLSTDRPVYRPGEQIFFRSVTLNRRTLASHLEVPIRFELRDASGALVEGAILEGVTERGVGNGSFVIPETSAGGTYQLIAKSLDGFFPDQTLELEVRRYRAVRLKTDLQFVSRSYTSGDRVEATLSVRRANDEIPAGATAKVHAVVDDQTIYQVETSIDLDGSLSIAFDLPKFIRQGEGRLSVSIDDGSVTETATRAIPIHTGRVSVDFYPEGGELVGGLTNRVYFKARDTDGKPIELAGEVLSQAGRVVATVETVRDGMGRFEFKPEPGMRYSLRVTKPLDITETPWLPTVVDDMPVLETGEGVFDAGEPITMTIRTLKRRQCLIRAVCRGELVGLQSVEVGIGDHELVVPIQDRATGVIRVTVLETDSESMSTTPLVERLVYRRGVKALQITATIDDDARQHQPGDPVRMTVSVKDENDTPVPGAILGVSVVDDAALSLRRQKLPSIQTHFFLTSEIESPEDLEQADIYLADDPEAAKSLDLLLGTQGWRRFISGDENRFDETFRDALVRLLELDGDRNDLVGKRRSNMDHLRSQLITYRTRATEIWQEFISDIRFTLMIVGFVWLIALLFRPRKALAPLSGLFLLGITIVGCGQATPTSTRAVPYNSTVEADLYQAEGESAEGMSNPSDERAHGAESVSDRSEPAAADDQTRPSFARRVFNVLMPGERPPTNTASDQSLENRISTAKLRQFAQARGIDTESLADQLIEELRFPIRQYAHAHRTSYDGSRVDFAETLYWNPLMVTDSTGTASIRFDLSDSLTMFKVIVNGHTNDGRLGSGGGMVVTQSALEVDAKIPLEVTGGDLIRLPVGLVNGTDDDDAFAIQVSTGEPLRLDRHTASVSAGAGDRLTEFFPIEVRSVDQLTEVDLAVTGVSSSTAIRDGVRRNLRIAPAGFPFTGSASGTLVRSAKLNFAIPEQIVPGSLHAELTLMPAIQSQISQGLQSILREPHGCFEQASSTNYPNVMAFQLMQVDGGVDPSDRRRIESLLRRGYRKLVSYECRELGYEWFGNDPGHEALSAFGLMQFSEMAKVIEVDEEMLQRTRRWLLDRRDGDGGFKRNSRHLHAWSVQQEIVNAYVLWALSEAATSSDQSTRFINELGKEIDQLERVATESDDAYLIALSAITLENANRTEVAKRLRERLVDFQKPDGHLDGVTTVTQSGGFSKQVETTALVILAWNADDQHVQQLRKATDWLLANRRGGGFGSTQATVLALKALVMTHRMIAGDGSGELELVVDNEIVDTIRWSDAKQEGVVYRLPNDVCKRIENDPSVAVELRSREQVSLPYTLQLVGQTKSPQSDPSCPLELHVNFPKSSDSGSINAGDSINVQVSVVNKDDQGQPMSVAVIGLPGGLEPVIEHLEQLRQNGVVDYYELIGRDVVCYWRTFAPGERKEFSLFCVGQIPGRYTGPPSRAYLYYTAEQKTWHDPLVIEID